MKEVSSHISKLNEQSENDVRYKDYDDGPIITFITVDGNTAEYTDMYPIFKEAEVPFTSAVVTSRVDNSNDYLTIEQMKEMQENGVEICSHTHTHPRLTEISDEELRLSKEWLYKNGFNNTVLCIPYNNYDERVIKYISKYYDAARRSSCQYNTTPLTTYQLHSRFLAEDSTFDEFKDWIDEAVDNNGWLIISTHGPEVRDWEIHDLLANIVDYSKSKAEIVTLSEGYKRKRNVVSSRVDYLHDLINLGQINQLTIFMLQRMEQFLQIELIRSI